jgi:nicotinamide-nucleotide amidase
VPLVINDDALENIQRIFARLGRDVLGVNKDQALVPENCTPIVNTKGTAPGMYFEEHNKIFASMPGVPYEMKAMMTKEILPRLKGQINDKVIVHETITVIGVPESYIAHTIADIEDNLPEQLKLAYLPNLNLVRLRLTGKSTNHNGDQIHQLIQVEMAKIKSVLGNVWFDGDKNISEILGSMLVEKGNTIGTIESCSGGYVAHQLTAVSGSSAYFVGSLLTYAYEAKVHNADISQDLLNKVGAVSEEVAHDMAKNAQQKLQVDYCISTTGIAGPGGGTETKPVGLVYIGLAKPNGEVEVKKCQFHGNRLQVIQRTANTAINMVRKALMES